MRCDGQEAVIELLMGRLLTYLNACLNIIWWRSLSFEPLKVSQREDLYDMDILTNISKLTTLNFIARTEIKCLKRIFVVNFEIVIFNAHLTERLVEIAFISNRLAGYFLFAAFCSPG